MDNLFLAWQEKWSSRRDQIVKRLELIETQLEELARKETRPPRLSVVGLPHDAHEMTSMSPC